MTKKALSDESLCHFLCHCIEDILELTEDQRALAKTCWPWIC